MRRTRRCGGKHERESSPSHPQQHRPDSEAEQYSRHQRWRNELRIAVPDFSSSPARTLLTTDRVVRPMLLGPLELAGRQSTSASR